MDSLYELGNNGISIPTDNILDRALPEVLANNYIFFNLRTVVRNALGAFKERNSPTALVSVKERVERDIEAFRDILSGMGTTLIVYSVPYEKLPRKGLVNYSSPRTDKQKVRYEIYKSAIDLCIEFAELELPKGFTNTKKNTLKEAIIITHYTHDLITAQNIKLLLLESHTGKVKRKIEWNTKLNIKDGMEEYIPFNPITYYILGDKGNDYVSPMNNATRKKLYEIAIKSDWTPATTINRVMFCLQHEDNIMYDYVKNFNKI